jgi:hypothetical protein
MKKPRVTPNAPSTVTCVKPLPLGRARHDQQVRSAWAAERHGTGSGAAKQTRGRRKPGSYSVR